MAKSLVGKSPLVSPHIPLTGRPGKATQANTATIKAIETCLQQTLATKTQAARRIDPHYANLLTQISQLVGRGGKRLRPQLVVQAYEAYGGSKRAAIIEAAASQELYHAFILMHDDIIDRDITRWGGPNISGHYLAEFGQLTSENEARHYADSWALLAGDICFNLSYEMLLDSDFPAAQLVKALRLVQQTLFTMVGGELLDTALPIYYPAETAINDERLLRVCDAKTASYSFCTPLRLGALLAGADVHQDKRLNAFGMHLGIAFQLRDDILGVFGNEQKLGKSTLSDIQEGKRTLLMNYAMRDATVRQKQQLQRIVGNSAASARDLQVIQGIMRATGALDKTEAILQQHCQQAHRILLGAGFPLALSDYLADLPAFCAKRSY